MLSGSRGHAQNKNKTGGKMKNSAAYLLLVVVTITLVSAAAAEEYVEYRPGTSNIILSAPHGGKLKPECIRSRDYGCRKDGKCVYSHYCGEKDKNGCAVKAKSDYWTRELAEHLSEELFKLSGKRPHLIINHLYRSKMDANREIGEAAFGNAAAEHAWRTYHAHVTSAKANISCFGLLLDIHGQSHKEAWTELGYLRSSDKLSNFLNSHYNYSSIRYLAERTGVAFEELSRGSTSLGGRLQEHGYLVVPSPSIPSPKEYEHFSGGYYSGGYITRRHGSRYVGVVDAIQIEAPRSWRNATVGPTYARELAMAVHKFTTEYY